MYWIADAWRELETKLHGQSYDLSEPSESESVPLLAPWRPTTRVTPAAASKTVDDSTGCSAAWDISDIITDNESFVTVFSCSALIWHKPCTSQRLSANRRPPKLLTSRTFDQCPLVTAARAGAGPGQPRDRWRGTDQTQTQGRGARGRRTTPPAAGAGERSTQRAP